MGGIGLSCNTTSTGYLTHTHTHMYTYTHVHMHAHNTHTIRTQYAHNMHTICTQYAHNMHTILHTHMHRTQIQDTQMHNNTLANIYINTEYRIQNTTIMQHREQNNTGATENNAQPQRTEQHNLVHIVLIFIITHIYQKTL